MHASRTSLSLVTVALAAWAAEAQAVRVRIAAANVTSGRHQSYEAAGQRILRGLQPDVTLIQEFNVGDNSADAIAAFVHAAFGAGFSWHREPGGDEIPNGIVSRWPILEAGQWDDPLVGNRDFAWARIDLPGERDLWAVSLHLLTTSAAERDAEAAVLADYVEALVPPTDYLVIGGDLNTDYRSERVVATLAAHVVTAGPYPVDRNGNGNTNRNRNRPYDWLLADPDLHALHAPLRIGTSIYPRGLVFDSRVYTPLADVPPVRRGDSDAENMQHMPVARDFVLPAAGDKAAAPAGVRFGILDALAARFTGLEPPLKVMGPFDLPGADHGIVCP